MTILSGDIGGTKSHFTLFEANEGNTLQTLLSVQLASRDFDHFDDLIQALKTKIEGIEIHAVSLGIAGPVIEGECITTNLPWKVSISDIKEMFGLSKCYLLNDLEATAYGMLYVPSEERLELNPFGQKRVGNCGVIAAGTGLGEAILYWDTQKYHPIGSEGGHTDFAPITPQQDELLRWLRREFPDHVSYERLLSGPGIYTLYRFLAQSGFAPEPDAMKYRDENDDPSVLIHQCAEEQHDPLCYETLKLFTQIYGSEAGNLALKSMSVGGIYIGGGIAPKIANFMKRYFMESFVVKGRFRPLLQQMSVQLSTNPQTALIGSVYYALDRFE